MWLRVKRYFLSGLVVFIPLALTVYLFVLTINIADGLLGKYIEPYFEAKIGFYFRGISIFVGVLIIFLIGFFATNFFGRKIHAFFERLLLKLPFFRQVYPALKEMAVFLFARDHMRFWEVVMVEYPRKGIYSFGFLTNDTAEPLKAKVKQDLCNVFIPSAPGPLTGFVVMVPRKELVFTQLTVEEVIKVIVSGGVINPV